MLRLAALLVLLASLATCTDDADDGRFPCGDHGGSCDAATEVCILGPEKCSTCAPLPDACDPDATCGCLPPGNDPMFAPFACVDAGVCAADGGLVLTCGEIEWGCG